MGVPEKAIAEGGAILRYIPQRHPIVMVDMFYSVDGQSAQTGLTVTGSNFFVDGGRMDECGLVEHMAQSAALRAGYLYISRGEKVPLGFIASVGKLTILRRPCVGEKITTTVTAVQEVMNITLLQAESWAGGEKCCECTMKIFLKPGGDEK